MSIEVGLLVECSKQRVETCPKATPTVGFHTLCNSDGTPSFLIKRPVVKKKKSFDVFQNCNFSPKKMHVSRAES